jgi:hypothetical protein
MDSTLELYRGDGTLLADDDNGGRGRCSLLDGTGSAPRDQGAFDLPRRTYYLKVTAAGEGLGAQRIFDYALRVVTRRHIDRPPDARTIRWDGAAGCRRAR